MSSKNTELSFRLTGDAKSLIDSLERSREAALKTYGTMRRGVEDAKQAWTSAQASVRNLAVDLRATEAPAAAQRAAFDAAVKKADELKAAYLRVRDGAHEQQQKLRENASAIDAARAAHVGLEQSSGSLAARWAALRNQSRDLTGETVSLGMALRAVAAGAAGAVGIGSLREVASLVDQYSALNSRIKLSVATSEEFVAGQVGVQRVAALNGQELSAVGSLYVRTSGAVRQFGFAQEDALKVTDLVGKAIRLSGATAQEAASANLQFAQAIGAGTLRGEELNAVLEAAPRLAQALADGLGVPQAKLKQLGEQGALTSKQVIAALLSQSDRLTAESAQAPLRLSEAWRTLGNSVQIYVGQADAGSGASATLAQGIRFASENVNVLVPGVAALGAGLTAVAATSAVRMLAGLAVATGPVGVTIGVAAAATVGLMAALANGSDNVLPGAEKALKALTGEVREFSDRMSEAQRAQKAEEMEAAIERLRDAYARMSLETPSAPILKRWMEEITQAEQALERLQVKTAKPTPFTLEKSTLGVATLTPVRGELIEKKQADALEAFDKSYAAFVERTVDGEGKLVFSYGQIKAALDNLLSSAKTPADLNALIGSLEAAQSKGSDAALASTMAAAVEARTLAESKALESRVAGMKTAADRAAAAFMVTAEQARVSMQLATGLARVTAELKGDTRAMSADQAAGIKAEAIQVASQANVQINLAQQVSDKKRAMIVSDRDAALAASKAVSDMAEEAEGKRFEQIQRSRADLEAQRKALMSSPRATAPEGSSQSDALKADLEKIAAQEKNLATLQAQLLDGGLERRRRNAEEAVRLEANAARQIAEVERATAQQRIEILRQAQSALVGRAGEALNAYKSYAQQVIQLDRQIATNRLDTASSISSIKRRDMTPSQQADSLREEMQRLRDEEAEAAKKGDKPQQLELLGRQKNVANELANVSGDGVDQKAMRQEAVGNLQRIGEESDSLLKSQREEASAAAEEQKATYQSLVESLKGLTAEIAKVSQSESIKLKAEIDTESVNTAVETVRQAFANATFAIRVAASTQDLPAGAAAPQARATGGPIFGAGTATSDSIPALLSNGEHVITAAEVRAAGGHHAIYALRAAMLGGKLPRFADGGVVGGLVDRLAIPSPIVREAAAPALQPINMAIPGGGSFPVQASPDVASAMDRHIRMQLLKRGRMQG